MTDALIAIMPIIGIVMLGWCAGRSGLFGEDVSSALSRFVFIIALPCLIFTSVVRQGADAWPSTGYLITLAAPMAALFAITLVLSRKIGGHSSGDAAVDGLIAVFSSSAYIGLPLALTLYGEPALPAAVAGTLLTGAVFLPVGVFFIAADRGGGGAAVKNAAKALANPIILAAIVAVTLSAAKIPPPTVILGMTDLIGGAFAPTALFAAGLFCAKPQQTAPVARLGVLIGAKLLLLPAMTWVLANIIGLTGLERTIAILFAALPTGVPVFVAAVGANVGADRASASILYSTGASLATLPILISLLS